MYRERSHPSRPALQTTERCGKGWATRAPQDDDLTAAALTNKDSDLALTRSFEAPPRQLVDALVLGVAGMAFDPMPAHLMLAECRLKPLPEVDVLHRLAIGRLPAVLFPAVNPAGDAAAQILAVGVEIDRRRAFQRFERRDCGKQLH